MSRLFNNKWSIIALALFAIYFVITNAILPYIGKNDVYADTIDTPGMLEFDIDPAALGSHSSGKVEINKVFWSDVPARDPFSPKTSILKDEIKNLRALNQTAALVKGFKREVVIDKPKITGFVFGSHAKLVVLDGVILSVGEQIKGFKIIKIEPDKVKLRQLKSNKIVTLFLE